jgi:hypothetical protein
MAKPHGGASLTKAKKTRAALEKLGSLLALERDTRRERGAVYLWLLNAVPTPPASKPSPGMPETPNGLWKIIRKTRKHFYTRNRARFKREHGKDWEMKLESRWLEKWRELVPKDYLEWWDSVQPRKFNKPDPQREIPTPLINKWRPQFDRLFKAAVELGVTENLPKGAPKLESRPLDWAYEHVLAWLDQLVTATAAAAAESMLAKIQKKRRAPKGGGWFQKAFNYTGNTYPIPKLGDIARHCDLSISTVRHNKDFMQFYNGLCTATKAESIARYEQKQQG